MDADDFSAQERVCETVERYAVVWVVEGRHENNFVGDVKVCVARGQALSFEDNGRR